MAHLGRSCKDGREKGLKMRERRVNWREKEKVEVWTGLDFKWRGRVTRFRRWAVE